MKWYNLDYLDKNFPDFHYHLIFGERSNGKTSAVLERILDNWINKGEKGAYIRRLDVEIRGARAKMVWTSMGPAERNLVHKYTHGEWTDILFHGGGWYLAKYDDDIKRYVKQPEPFCYAFALNVSESYKGNSFPEVTTILFDEFMTRHRYLANEFLHFQNLLSTIIRQRDNVKVYLLGNTVNMYSPYFDEMGVDGADTMEPGQIKPYFIENSINGKSTKVAVQYCKNNDTGKDSDVYFQFENKTSKMITGGEWEIPMYPHIPLKYKASDIIDIFFIEFRDKIIQGDIIAKDDYHFIYLHKKTTPIKDDDKMIYNLTPSPKLNHAVSLKGPIYRNKISEAIGKLFKEGQVYFQDNTIGELIRNYEELAQASKNML